ncbi:PRKDC [Branchiostoma lanceolatum]|uniref:DNA-dependent protein kinase catalytic subunit n=1 Tax=Branchiostoma lanceolatum TaxID=7740 RepID=A0A8K0AD24_BRALA|nr:PRKDC [Branchiostoma lanceolatum]
MRIISLTDDREDAEDNARHAQLLTAAGVSQDTSVEQTISSLLQKGHACLQKAVKLATDEEKARQDSSLDKSGIVDAFMAMVSFCDKILRHQEDDDKGTELTSIPGLPAAVVSNLLQALRHDSPEARQRFPRLLQLVELYPDTMDLFIQKVSQVPSWLCISWLGQMVALLDKPEAVAVHGVLTRIAQDYPQALVYPLKISSENFEFEDSVVGRRNQEAVTKLKKTLSVIYTLVDKLIGGLEQLSHPDQLFKDWGDDADLKRLLKVDPKKRTKEDKVNIKRLYEEMYNSLLDFRSPSQDSSMSSLFGSSSSELESQSVGFGPFRRRFAQQFAKECDKMFGKDGGRILDMKEKEFLKLKSGMQGMMGDFYRKAFPREKGNCYAPGLLKDYCPWLSDFNPLDYDRELEIPGQYTGKVKPLVQYHAKIAGFDQRVKVMSSLRKPKRITIRGDDERDRPFLVKGGEDLRQDQRIQQLFDIMNDILTLDPACSQRQLRIRTYGVIPMTSR